MPDAPGIAVGLSVAEMLAGLETNQAKFTVPEKPPMLDTVIVEFTVVVAFIVIPEGPFRDAVMEKSGVGTVTFSRIELGGIPTLVPVVVTL